MEVFDFFLPTKIKLGTGLFSKAGQFVKETVTGNKILLVTDPGIEQLGIVDTLLSSLENEDFQTKVFNGVRPNPKDTDCMNGAEVARQFEADVILAIGGGSVIDSAKAIAILQVLGGKPQDYAGRNKVPTGVTPLVVIPTTAGTGAEVTRSSVITDTTQKTKFTIKDVHIAPVLAIVDPELTYKLPKSLTASTGMDALVHAIEAFTCKLSNPIADGLALQAMKHIYPHLRTAVHEGTNKEARYQVMIGSTIAGMAFSHADVASVHCMAEAIGGLYDTPHGVANSMFLPYIVEFNAEADITKHAMIARTIGISSEKDTDEEATAKLVIEMKQLAQDLSIPTFSSLPEVKEEDFEYLAQSSFLNGSTPSNAREITTEDYLELFKKAYKNE
ncbi:alcohol dehydrogenase [Bacillus mesophilus]|uniref:Iron-containing alcohol dehydrogenase n=1 Tax=Bacillus mesophilus TaxID=1808955 RepID=A0A6M0Q8H3_9BACI|nr:iron-containing alcohol dehydrogenase [Bacillus mesophilus]MBM7661986.1 alcohol dehydrogenase [Bacillus mesophilus]NEY72655.1 iron-containing alcohol dehydrogenase [Bacillus mesophilus]